MTTPSEDQKLLVHAYVDGELDSSHALEVERLMEADPALAAERDRILALRNLIRGAFPREPPPPGLQARIERAVGLRRTDSKPSWRALAASILVTAMVTSGSTFLVTTQRDAGDRVAEDVMDAHLRAMMAPQPADVPSSDRHTVKPWFNGRIPESPRVVDLATQGFPLVGGRIDVVERKPVPTLVYHRNKHLISLTALPAPGRTNSPPVRRETDGYHLLRWTDDGVTYVAVSDVSGADLDNFASLFRTTPPDQ
jgi:anti-sigma factor RsiW